MNKNFLHLVNSMQFGGIGEHFRRILIILRIIMQDFLQCHFARTKSAPFKSLHLGKKRVK
jgi:hypothetical protein